MSSNGLFWIFSGPRAEEIAWWRRQICIHESFNPWNKSAPNFWSNKNDFIKLCPPLQFPPFCSGTSPKPAGSMAEAGVRSRSAELWSTKSTSSLFQMLQTSASHMLRGLTWPGHWCGSLERCSAHLQTRVFPDPVPATISTKHIIHVDYRLIFAQTIWETDLIKIMYVKVGLITKVDVFRIFTLKLL